MFKLQKEPATTICKTWRRLLFDNFTTGIAWRVGAVISAIIVDAIIGLLVTQ